jgi:hypothetical protein
MPKHSLLERISAETLEHIDFPIHLLFSTPSPWAVLLVKFADDPAADPDKTIYQKLFTSAGGGTANMPSFFEDMSHGRLDLSGSKVFGWYKLSAKRSDYVGNVYPQPTGKLNRNGLVDATKAAAIAAGVDLSKFAGVVVSAYGSTDLCGWVGGMTALCDQFSLQPSLLGQEMGHGYGLDHARAQGSTDDYQDPWDVMSTAAWPWMEEPDPNYTEIGPGLNAWCMRSRGWLDENRVWSNATGAYDATVTLRPLHWRELSGYLAAEIGPYLVELRVPERWDAGIDAAAVLVHRFHDNHSYVMSADNGLQAMNVGSVLTVGRQDWVYGDYYRIEVTALDAHAHTATVHLQYRPSIPLPHVPELVGTLVGGAQVGGQGILILPGGKVIHIPPRGPVYELMAKVGQLAESELSGDIALGIAARRSLLRSIVATTEALFEENELVSSGPPRVKQRNSER